MFFNVLIAKLSSQEIVLVYILMFENICTFISTITLCVIFIDKQIYKEMLLCFYFHLFN